MAGGRRTALEPRPSQPSLRVGQTTQPRTAFRRHPCVADVRQRMGMTDTAEDARADIAKVRWQFAKTMPQWPHEYTVLLWRQDLESAFREFVGGSRLTRPP